MTDAGAAPEKRSVVLAGHRTSVSLEPAFWTALKDIAARKGESVQALVERIDAQRTTNLSSAIRLHVLADLQRRLAEAERPSRASP